MSVTVVASFVGDILSKRKMYAHHVALWSTSFDDRGKQCNSILLLVMFCVVLWTPGKVADAFAKSNGDPNK